ncbi:hypothetical protein HDU93_003427, partial [Gonapodya sp. JEL0774]
VGRKGDPVLEKPESYSAHSGGESVSQSSELVKSQRDIAGTATSAPRARRSTENPASDYRFGPISIDWMDIREDLQPPADSIEARNAVTRMKNRSGDETWTTVGRHRNPKNPSQSEVFAASAAAVSPISDELSEALDLQDHAVLPTSAVFIPHAFGNSTFNSGVIHLYREAHELDSLRIKATPQQRSVSDEDNNLAANQGPSDSDSPGDSQILAILAVPPYMTTSDFLSFITPSHLRHIAHLRFLRDSLPNRYMVLLKFQSQPHAETFRTEFIGRKFSSLGKEVCQVVNVSGVEFVAKEMDSTAAPGPSAQTIPIDPERLFNILFPRR